MAASDLREAAGTATSNRPTNGRELRVIGLSRSGNHAILGWILEQLKGTWVFLNCAEARTNPFGTARPMDDGATHRTNVPGFDLAAERRGHHLPRDHLVVSHEDSFLGYVQDESYEANHDAWVGTSGTRRDVLVLRDPFNLIASRRTARVGWVRSRTALRIWRQHAREALGPGRSLPRDRVLVRYNDWVCSRDYRERVAGALGLRFTDEGREAVPPVGGGSSFDGGGFDGRASEMRVLERWRAFADDPGFRELFDEETLSLSEALFGRLPGLRAWLEA